jgi:hypothetical protein
MPTAARTSPTAATFFDIVAVHFWFKFLEIVCRLVLAQLEGTTQSLGTFHDHFSSKLCSHASWAGLMPDLQGTVVARLENIQTSIGPPSETSSVTARVLDYSESSDVSI